MFFDLDMKCKNEICNCDIASIDVLEGHLQIEDIDGIIFNADNLSAEPNVKSYFSEQIMRRINRKKTISNMK